MNEFIEYTRNEVRGSFQGSFAEDYPTKTKYFSPDKKYFFDMEVFSKPMITFGNHFFAKIAIFDAHSQEKIFDVLNNHSKDHHQWLEIEGKTYLFFAEFATGMTVYNLTEKKCQSFIGAEDRHQIIQYYPSPDLMNMAVVRYGNYPRCEIAVYDISRPMILPYPLVYRDAVAETQEVESLKWLDGMYLDVVYREQIRIGKTLLKVEVFEVFDDDFWLRCRFKDIHGKEYVCTEKVQAMIGSVDEHTKFPFSGAVDVGLIKKYTLDKQKIATIGVDLGAQFYEAQIIDVFDNQLETYWYYKNLLNK